MMDIQLIPSRFKGKDVQFFIDQDGQAWWPAKGPCEVLGYDLGHVSDVLSRFVDDEDKRLFNLPDSRGGWRETLVINESGLYALILGSHKPEAKAFKRWITHEVLPALRKTGHYELNQARLIENTKREIQVEHSKQVATFQHVKGGPQEIIRWFRVSSKHISDLYPKEWTNKAQAMGMGSRYQRSWRETMRVLAPAKASGVSLSDDCLVHGLTEEKALEIGKDSIALFQKMLDAGLRPPELQQSPLDKP
jgi:prophage antirepressor-like protein